MGSPSGSIAAATRSGAESVSGRNPYPPDTPERQAFRVAREESVRAGTIRLLHDRIKSREDTIAIAEADIAEALEEIARLEASHTGHPGH